MAMMLALVRAGYTSYRVNSTLSKNYLLLPKNIGHGDSTKVNDCYISYRVNSTLSKLINNIHRTWDHDVSIGKGWLHLLRGLFHPLKTQPTASKEHGARDSKKVSD